MYFLFPVEYPYLHEEAPITEFLPRGHVAQLEEATTDEYVFFEQLEQLEEPADEP